MRTDVLEIQDKYKKTDLPKVVVSCSGKFHAFALSEQLENNGLLREFYTSYAYQKNKLMRRFAGRVDKEAISPKRIHTLLSVAFMIKSGMALHEANERFDKWVANKLTSIDFDIFIGWSGMSLYAMRKAKNLGKKVVVERGSSHISYQNEILKKEYRKFGVDFQIDPRTIEKEIAEYEIADYISIPSSFVKRSFLEYGVPNNKLIQNAYGASSHFKKANPKSSTDKFRILYLGNLTIQKGLIYLFEALQKLVIPQEKFEMWFIGKVVDELNPTIEQFQQDNWKFFGHVDHYKLPELISVCDVAVQPSLQEGLSMVIPQMLSCGVPVIATTNTGGEDVISNNENGFIIPVRNSKAISEKIELLYFDQEKLTAMKNSAVSIAGQDLSWNNYGNRYVDFLKKLASEQ